LSRNHPSENTSPRGDCLLDRRIFRSYCPPKKISFLPLRRGDALDNADRIFLFLCLDSHEGEIIDAGVFLEQAVDRAELLAQREVLLKLMIESLDSRIWGGESAKEKKK